jgi:hypothetical protein
VDATRGRSRPPPSRRRRRDAIRLPPLSLQSLPPSQLPHHQSTATPAAITTSECATIDATALSRPLSPEALHGQAHLGTVTTASAVDFQGPPAAAAAVTPVAAIAPATILAATAGAAERCDVREGLMALPPPAPL